MLLHWFNLLRSAKGIDALIQLVRFCAMTTCMSNSVWVLPRPLANKYIFENKLLYLDLETKQREHITMHIYVDHEHILLWMQEGQINYGWMDDRCVAAMPYARAYGSSRPGVSLGSSE